MAARARGLPFDQHTAAEAMYGSRRGFALRDLAPLLGPGAHFVAADPDDPATVPYVEAQLAGGAWVIAQVFVAELVACLVRHASPPQGPFGPLSGVLHCVVLVAAERRGIWYFDPFFGPDGQPLLLERIDLARVLQSNLLVMPPDRGPP